MHKVVSYLRYCGRARRTAATAVFDPQLPSIDNKHARPTTTAPHLDSNQKEPGAHVISPAGFPSIADVTALFCGGACRIVPSSTGGCRRSALRPSDLIDALALDLFGAQCQILLLADHRAPRTVCGCQLVILEHRHHLGVRGV